MNVKMAEENILLVAVGSSSKKIAVTVAEILSESDYGYEVSRNLKVLSIDAPASQYPGFVVPQEDYLPLIYPGMDLFQIWAELKKSRVNSNEPEEPWMTVGPISEIELFLARDAQQTGIRRVDYFLLIHHARARISQKIRQTLQEFSDRNSSNKKSKIILLSSLVGRTGSVSYLPVLKIIESISSEFEGSSIYSLLLTPNAFDYRLYSENEFNFLDSLISISSYSMSQIEQGKHSAKVLIDEKTPLLMSYRDEDTPVQSTESILSSNTSIERIILVITKDTHAESFGAIFPKVELAGLVKFAEDFNARNDGWMRSNFSRVHISDLNKVAIAFQNLSF